jgi:hypothetical protein
MLCSALYKLDTVQQQIFLRFLQRVDRHTHMHFKEKIESKAICVRMCASLDISSITDAFELRTIPDAWHALNNLAECCFQGHS